MQVAKSRNKGLLNPYRNMLLIIVDILWRSGIDYCAVSTPGITIRIFFWTSIISDFYRTLFVCSIYLSRL